MSGANIQHRSPDHSPRQSGMPRSERECKLQEAVSRAFEVAQAVERAVRAGSGRRFTMSYDTVAHPGRLLSGSVTFSDGQSAMWFVDQDRRFSMSPQQQGHQSSQADLESLQTELENKLQTMGLYSRAHNLVHEQISSHEGRQLATERLANGGSTRAASLGIETLGGISTLLIKGGTALPCRLSEIFSTACDNQLGVEIHVLQGDRALARDNKTIGKFNLTDILPSPRGVPQIEVTFDIDANGMLHVSAKDLGTGKEQRITINASSGLSNEGAEEMRRDANAHADEDRRQLEEIALRNAADGAVYRSEKMLRENADKIPKADKSKIEDASNAVKEALKATDVSSIHSTNQKLDEIWQAVSAELYRSSRGRRIYP